LAIIDQSAVGGRAAPGRIGKLVMNTSDIYVRYEACEIGEQKPLRVFARVPRVKICAFQQASDDPTFSDEEIAKILATPDRQRTVLVSYAPIGLEFLAWRRPR
jgi:hypothetical protein